MSGHAPSATAGSVLRVAAAVPPSFSTGGVGRSVAPYPKVDDFTIDAGSLRQINGSTLRVVAPGSATHAPFITHHHRPTRHLGLECCLSLADSPSAATTAATLVPAAPLPPAPAAPPTSPHPASRAVTASSLQCKRHPLCLPTKLRATGRLRW